MSNGDFSGLSAAADRIRETAKWIIASFAAIGAALIAGTQLSGIGSIDSNARLVLAACSAIVALGGVGWAIWEAGKVSTASTVSLGDLAESNQLSEVRQTIDKDQALLEGHQGVGSLATSYGSWLRRRTEAYEAYFGQPSDETLRINAKIADQQVLTLSAIVQSVLLVASYLRLAAAFRSALRRIFLAGIIAALGIGVFVWNVSVANSGASQSVISSVDAGIPSNVVIQLTPAAAPLVDAELGKTCHDTTLTGVALANTSNGLRVLTDADGQCSSRVLTLNSRSANVTELPAPMSAPIPPRHHVAAPHHPEGWGRRHFTPH
jgi:hypothetical protein